MPDTPANARTISWYCPCGRSHMPVPIGVHHRARANLLRLFVHCPACGGRVGPVPASEEAASVA